MNSIMRRLKTQSKIWTDCSLSFWLGTKCSVCSDTALFMSSVSGEEILNDWDNFENPSWLRQFPECPFLGSLIFPTPNPDLVSNSTLVGRQVNRNIGIKNDISISVFAHFTDRDRPTRCAGPKLWFDPASAATNYILLPKQKLQAQFINN